MSKLVLTLKALSKVVADSILKINFVIFQRKKDFEFHVNHLADDSHEMSNLISSEK